MAGYSLLPATIMPRKRVYFCSSASAAFENFISRVHAEDRDRVRQAIQNAIEERKVYDSEFRVVLPNGSVRWMTARGTVQVNSSGDPERLLGVSVDVTARKQAELQAHEQRDELEQLRQQKTALLEREVAERARLEREVIDICAREQRRIAYDLHDSVGQQLVGIALCAKLLEEQLRGERPSEADKAGMIVKLVNDAARQARLTARTLEGADGVGDLRTALKSLAISVSQNCSVEATVTAEGSSLPISPPVAAQLYRIAQEAVHNAVEHGAAREVQINLAFNHEVMLLTIRDNGKGFASNANGNGMGLRIMRYRAQCIGGSCDVQSTSEGTVVRCRVPLEPQLAAFGSAMSPIGESQMKSRVIVVEDHPVLCDGLMQLISRQPDLTCTSSADNTSDAKRLVEQSKPDLTLLDLRLKTGDLLDLIKSLRVEHPDTEGARPFAIR